MLASQAHELTSHTGREGSTRAPRPLPPNTTHQIIERHENINQSCATMSRARNKLASQTHELTSHTGREGNTRAPRPLPPNTTRQFIKHHTPSCANIACFVNIHVNHPAPRIHTIVSWSMVRKHPTHIKHCDKMRYTNPEASVTNQYVKSYPTLGKKVGHGPRGHCTAYDSSNYPTYERTQRDA